MITLNMIILEGKYISEDWILYLNADERLLHKSINELKKTN